MTEKTLFIPELRHHILSFCDNATLARCAHINHEWFAAAIPLLWRVSPPLDILRRLAHNDRDRFRGYIKHVDSLRLCQPTRHSASRYDTLWDTELWTTVRPKHVYIMLEHYEMSRSVTTSFLSTHLEHLEGHYYNLCNQEFLHRIQTSAHSLKSLTIWTDGFDDEVNPNSKHYKSDVQPCHLLQFLQQLPHIRSISIDEGFVVELVDASVVRHIFMRANIENIELTSSDEALTSSSVFSEAFRYRFTDQTHLKPRLGHLRSLILGMRIDAEMRTILSQAPHLQKVDLESIDLSVLSLSQDILSPLISSCPDLVDLSLRIDNSGDCSEYNFVGLGRGCPRLLKLTIGGWNSGQRPLPIDVFRSLVQELPNIETLRLLLPWDFEGIPAAFEFMNVAKLCPHLNDLSLSMNVDLAALGVDDYTFAFNNLRSLTLHNPIFAFASLSPEPNPDIGKCVDHLKVVFAKLMPQLRRLSCYGNVATEAERRVLRRMNCELYQVHASDT